MAWDMLCMQVGWVILCSIFIAAQSVHLEVSIGRPAYEAAYRVCLREGGVGDL